MPGDWDVESARLAGLAMAEGQSTRWFEEHYDAGVRGEIGMPWDRAAPMPALQDWTIGCGPAAGRSAVVVGCALGVDAEFLSANGFRTTAVDISSTAVRTALTRHPNTTVDYRVADLLTPPPEWWGAFDLVIENVRDDGAALPERPPWPFDAAEIRSFAEHGLIARAITRAEGPPPRWRAEFTRTVG